MVPQWAQTLKGLNPPPSRAAKGLHKPHPPQPPTPGSRTCSLRFSMLTYFQFPSKHTVPLPELPPFHSLTYTLSLSPSLPPQLLLNPTQVFPSSFFYLQSTPCI